jgi:hypothetical protein
VNRPLPFLYAFDSYIQDATERANKSLRVRGGALFLDGDDDEKVRKRRGPHPNSILPAPPIRPEPATVVPQEASARLKKIRDAGALAARCAGECVAQRAPPPRHANSQPIAVRIVLRRY